MKKFVQIFLFLFLFSTSFISANDKVYLGGDSIGIVSEYEGLYISGTYSFEYNNATYNPYKEIKEGDLLIKVNNINIKNLDDFNSIIKKYKSAAIHKIDITLIRNKEKINTYLYAYYNNGNVESGIYIKEKITGLGTITYYDPSTLTFAALGHPISDNNNDYLQNGIIYASTIFSINKATNNINGEKIGTILYEKPIGEINKNLNIGIYGTYTSLNLEKNYIEIGDFDEIKIGEAWIYTVLENEKIERFKISITYINNDKKNEKSIEFEVTDINLIERCGGIIHGMSGSPIVQNGKLIGAVTHVQVNDPKKGYGIFIKYMIETSQ